MTRKIEFVSMGEALEYCRENGCSETQIQYIGDGVYVEIPNEEEVEYLRGKTESSAKAVASWVIYSDTVSVCRLYKGEKNLTPSILGAKRYKSLHNVRRILYFMNVNGIHEWKTMIVSR